MKPFDDPEALRTKLPADVLAFVAEQERLSKWANTRHRDDLERTCSEDVPMLIAIVREQAKAVQTDAEILSAGFDEEKRLRERVAELEHLFATACENQELHVRAELLVMAERDELRERLIKLEATANDFVDAVDAYENGHDGALYDVAKEKRGALILLLAETKGDSAS